MQSFKIKKRKPTKGSEVSMGSGMKDAYPTFRIGADSEGHEAVKHLNPGDTGTMHMQYRVSGKRATVDPADSYDNHIEFEIHKAELQGKKKPMQSDNPMNSVKM